MSLKQRIITKINHMHPMRAGLSQDNMLYAGSITTEENQTYSFMLEMIPYGNWILSMRNVTKNDQNMDNSYANRWFIVEKQDNKFVITSNDISPVTARELYEQNSI